MSYMNILKVAKSGTKSTFGSELEELFQIVIDKRDSIDLDRPEARNRIVEEVFKLLEKDFTAVIKKHTNLDIAVNQTSGVGAIQLTSSLVNEKINYAVDIDMVRGYYTKDTPPTTVKDFIKITNSIIDYYVPNPEQLVYKYFKFQIVLDPLFLFNNKTMKNVHMEELTAGEATAILLHEIYHAINILKSCGVVKTKLFIAQNQYNYFIEKSSVSEKIKLLEIAKQSESKKKFPNKKVLDSISETIEAVSKFDLEVIEHHSKCKLIKDNITDLTKLVLMIFIALPISIIINDVFGQDTLKQDNFVGYLGDNYNNNSAETFDDLNKIDDFPGFKTAFAKVEMESDAFAAKHGYGAQAITALDKLLKSSLNVTQNQKKSKFAYQINNVFVFIFENVLPSLDFDLYEDMGNRMNSIRLNTIKELKNSFKNPEVLRMYLNSLSEMEKTKQDVQKRISTRAFIQRIHKFLHSGFKEELDKVMKHIQTLQNNDLYISAAKLQDMNND